MVCRFFCIVLGVVEGVEASVKTSVKRIGVGSAEFAEVSKVYGHVHCCMSPVEVLKQRLLLLR